MEAPGGFRIQKVINSATGLGRRLEDEKDNERIRREQQAEEARCSWDRDHGYHT